MSFIDYNFFPILFFLGWNILTTKQFRPNISSTLDFKTLPGLSVFSLESPLSQGSLFLNQKHRPGRIFDCSKMRNLKQGTITNSINQKTLQSYVNDPETSHILEFIPEFRFLSENQKLIIIPQTNTICSENQTNNGSIFKNKPFNNSFLNEFYNSSQQSEEGKKRKLKHRILTPSKHPLFSDMGKQGPRSPFVYTKGECSLDGKITVYKKEKFIINYIAKPTKWFINENKTHYFTNHNLINNNWKKDFKSNLFNFVYRPKRKTFLSFFSYHYKMKPILPEIELLLNSVSVLPSRDTIRKGLNQHREKKRFLSVSPRSNPTFLNSQKSGRVRAFDEKNKDTSLTRDPNLSKMNKDINRSSSASIFSDIFLNGNSVGLIWPSNHPLFSKKQGPPSSFVSTKGECSLDSLLKDHFCGGFENDIFFKGLCFSQNNISFWKKIQKQLAYTRFFNKIAYSQINSFLKSTPAESLTNQMKNGSILQKRDLKNETFSTKKAELGLRNDDQSSMDHQFLNPTTPCFLTGENRGRVPLLYPQKGNARQKEQLIPVGPSLTMDPNPSKIDKDLNRSLAAFPGHYNDPTRSGDQVSPGKQTRPYNGQVSHTGLKKNNDYNQDSGMFKSSFLCIKANTKKLNNTFLIQKRRAQIRLLLRVSNQNIYSLNQFQIPLCFSKIVKSQNIFPKTRFLGNSEGTNNSFVKSDQEIDYVGSHPMALHGVEPQAKPHRVLDNKTRWSKNVIGNNVFWPNNYKKKKKNWYMKTQFFQHIAWNMQHSILDHFSNFEDLFRTNDSFVKNHDFGTKSSHQNKKSGLNKNYFSEEPKKTLQGYTICQNYFLRIYAGSWYYENLAFPYSIFNTINKTPLLTRHCEPIFNYWQQVFFKQKNLTPRRGGEKLLESKRVAIAWFYARRYNSLQRLCYWPYQNKFEYDRAILSGSAGPDKNQTQRLALQGIKGSAEKRLKSNSLTRSNHDFNNSQDLSIVLPQSLLYQTRQDVTKAWGETQNYKKDPFFEKSQIRLESDIGIYSLAHKLSSVGFRNGNNSSNIYPWRYNDSYRYNFQNHRVADLSNQGLKDFLGFSNSAPTRNQNTDPFVFSRKNTNTEQNFTRDKRTHVSNFRKFLDFQNPIFSKIYAPIFQPQDLNLLSFITNSFLNVMPNSIVNPRRRGSMGFFGFPSMASHRVKQQAKSHSFLKTEQTSHAVDCFLPEQIQPPQGQINDYAHDLKNSVGFQNTPKKREMLNSLYHKLPINGIHTNPYPWITQNAFDRWSASDSLWTLSDPSCGGFFSPGFSLYNPNRWGNKLLNPFVTSYEGVDKNTRPSVLTTSVNMRFPTISQKASLKNPSRGSSQLHFTEKASCIKKPSVFFSSFRYLPYSFISETLSPRAEPREKNFFPQANLSRSLLVDSSNYQSKKPVISPSNEHSPFVYTKEERGPCFPMPENRGCLDGIKNIYSDLSIPQYDLFNNNILKENQKKTVLQTWKGSLQHKSFSLKPLSTFVKKEFGYQTSLFSWENNYWPNHNSIKKTNRVPLQKNTWKVFPPLFQPLTFRFIDLNLPRTWSSELLTSLFNNSFFSAKAESQKDQKVMLLNTNKPPRGGFSNLFQNTKDSLSKKKLFGSNSIASHILSPLEQRRPGVKQQTEPNILPHTGADLKWNVTQKNFFRFSLPFYLSDFFRFSVNENPPPDGFNTEFYPSAFPLTNIGQANEYKQLWNNKESPSGAFEKKNRGSQFNETKSSQGRNSKIVVYGEKPLLKNRTLHGPPLKNQKESISLPNYLKNITNQNYQNLCPNNLNELYSVFWILFNKTLFIYLSLHYLRKFISFLGTEYIRNLFKIFVTMKFIDGNILSIIKTFQDFNFQLNQQNVIDIKVNKQLKEIKRN